MNKTWNRTYPLAALAAVAFLGNGCAQGESPASPSPASSGDERGATTLIGSSGAQGTGTDPHAGHDHANPLPDEETESMEYGGDAGGGSRSESGLDVLDTGIDVSGLRIDVGGGGPVASTGSGAAPRAQEDRGLQRPAPRYLGGISFSEGEKPVHSFGNVREGEARQKKFKFVSDGNEDLVIRTIKPSCGCTKAEVELLDDQGAVTAKYVRGDPISVGQEFQLLTEISLDGKHGHVEASVGLLSNDPEGIVNVKLVAEVERVLLLEPDVTSLYFGEMSVLDQSEKMTRVTTTRGELFHLEVDQTTPLPESIEVTFEPLEPDADGRATAWDVKVTMGPGLDEGIRNYPLYLISDLVIPKPKYPNEDGSPKFFSVALGLQAKVAGLVSAKPGYIGFGLVRPGQVHERTVSIECADDFVLSAESEVVLEGLYGGESPYPDAFEVKLGPLPEDSDINGLALTLTLKGMPEEHSGSFGGRLRVIIKHPAKEELLLRFSGICRAGLPSSGGN